jgi:hypothetical protein
MGLLDFLGNDFLGMKSGFLDMLASQKPTPPPIQNNYLQESRTDFLKDKMAGSQQNSTADILRRLEALQNPERFMDFGSIDSQARSSANAQFEPLIAALRAQAGSATQRGEENKAKLGQMFSSLSTDLSNDIPQIQEQFAGTKERTQGEYDQLKSMIGGQYDDSLASQEAMLKRLNIQAAAPDMTEAQFRDRDYFTNLANKEAQTAQTAIGHEETGATEFTRKGSELATVEGTQRQADLMSQLSQMLNEIQGQIGANEAARESTYQSNKSTLTGQMQDSASKRAQQEFDNYIKSIQLGRDLSKDSTTAAGAVKSPADVATRALGMGLSQSQAQQVQNTFMQSVGTDPSILAGINTQYGTSLPKEALAARVVENARAQGMSQSQINALQVIALEYFGRQ